MSDDVVRIRGLEPAASADEALVLSLRERGATALERALGFVEDYGDDLARLRAHVVLDAAAPEAVIEALVARQHDDGSCPPLGGVFPGAWVGELRAAAVDPALLGSLEALAMLSEVRGLARPVSERLVGFASRAQRSDGSWGHLDPVRENRDPEGALVRAVDERLFVTGMLAGYLLRTAFVRPEVIEWAGRFLSKLWAPERVEDGRLSAIAAYANFFANGGAPELSDEAMQWCGRELERGFRSHRFEAVDTLRVLASCDVAAMPGARFDVVELLERLLAEQAQDGGFAALDPGGPPGRVGPTIDALMAVRSLCQAL